MKRNFLRMYDTFAHTLDEVGTEFAKLRIIFRLWLEGEEGWT